MAISNKTKSKALKLINELEEQNLQEAERQLCERTSENKRSGHERQLRIEDGFEEFLTFGIFAPLE